MSADDFSTERHRCEVRMLIRAYVKPGRDWVVNYLNDPKVKGRRKTLLADITEQREKGNTGKEGAWL